MGAMMLFGERYGEASGWSRCPAFPRAVRRHPCAQHREIGALVIQREASSSQGVRRIEAVTGAAAIEHLRTRAADAARLESELAELRGTLKKVQRAGGDAASGNGREGALVEQAREEGGIRFVAAVVEGADADALLAVSDRVKARIAPGVVVLGSTTGGKVHLIASADGAAVERGLSAVDLIKQIAPIVGGGGGGRPSMARAGGDDPSKLPEAVEAAENAIRDRLRQHA